MYGVDVSNNSLRLLGCPERQANHRIHCLVKSVQPATGLNKERAVVCYTTCYEGVGQLQKDCTSPTKEHYDFPVYFPRYATGGQLVVLLLSEPILQLRKEACELYPRAFLVPYQCWGRLLLD